MSISRLRTETQKLRNSIVSKYKPVFKVFILGTMDSPTEAEIKAYSQAHPFTQVLKLKRQSCRKD